jgi:soluble lytic murein transglycosylase-like protein
MIVMERLRVNVMEKVEFSQGVNRRVVYFLLLGSCIFVPAVASADVIDISPTGNATVYKGPTVFNGTSTTPIVATPAVSANSGVNPTVIANPDPRFPMTMHPVLVGYLNDAATRFNIEPALVQAVAWQESRFRSDLVSPKGAIGIMQLMPATARQLGVNPNDPRQNIYGGVAYLSMLLTRFNGDKALALAAYNAGPEAVAQYRGIPPFRETQNYVKAIGERISLR